MTSSNLGNSLDDDRARQEDEARNGPGQDRGQRAGFDRRTGEVHGSGAGAGGSGDPGEDYDRDPKGGSGAYDTDSGSTQAPRP